MTNARERSNRLADLLRKERHALADFLVALAGFDGGRAWLELGYSSLFGYLHQDLGLSKGASFYRMTAAQLVQRHPEIVEPLRDGRLCLTTVVELSKVLTRENLAEVLPRFFHLSKRVAKEVSAELSPAPAPERTIVTAVRAAAPPSSGLTSVSWLDEPTRVAPTQESRSPAVSAPPVRMVVEPKTVDRSRIHLTVSRAFLRKLEAARDALSHSHPGASEEEILAAGLDLLLKRHAKRRGLVKHPRKAPAAPRQVPDRYVPAHVRREVWKRDGGRCQWPLESGGICGSTHQVELDHIQPVAKGGPSTAENVRCACKAHNLRAAREEFGDAWMDRCTRHPPRVKEDSAVCAAAPP
jgi:hypothetical protein